VAVGDFNADGKPDLVTANQGSYPGYAGSVSVLLGQPATAPSGSPATSPPAPRPSPWRGTSTVTPSRTWWWRTSVSNNVRCCSTHRTGALFRQQLSLPATAGEAHAITVTPWIPPATSSAVHWTVTFGSSDGQAVLPVS